MNSHWATYHAGMFSMELPAGWRTERMSASMLQLQDPRGQLTVSFTTAPRSAGLDAEETLRCWVQGREQGKGVEKLGAGVAGCEGVVGEARGKGLREWVRGWAQWRREVRWRCWAVVRGQVAVMVKCEGKRRLLERHRATLDRIVGSVMMVKGEAGARRVVEERRETWGVARGKVLPRIMTEAAMRGAAGVVHEPWVNELEIAYAMAGPGAAQGEESLVTTGDLGRWKVSAEEVHAQAVQNLVLQSHEYAMQGQKGEGFTVLFLGKNGEGAEMPAEEQPAYVPRGTRPAASVQGKETAAGSGAPQGGAAARILLPELHRKLREHLGRTFFAAIPSRDLLMAFAVTDEGLLEKFRQHVEEEFGRAGAGGLSPRLFLVTPDGIAGDPESGWEG